MKIRQGLWKGLKILLWIVFLLLIGLFVLGYVKHDGSVKDYFKYLNGKDWKDSISRVKVLEPMTYGNVFWDADVDEEGLSGAIVDLEVEELPLDLTGTEEDPDVFDPEFQDDFEAFFAEEGEESGGERGTLKTEEDFLEDVYEENEYNVVAGFKTTSGSDSVDKEEELDDGDYLSGDVELSENKKSLLKLMGEE